MVTSGNMIRVPSDMLNEDKSPCASMQSDHKLCYPIKDVKKLYILNRLSKMHPVKILIILHSC